MSGPSSRSPSVATDHVKNVAYGYGREITSLQYLSFESRDEYDNVSQNYSQETRTYNALYQLTRQSGGGVDLEYRYSATANNGRITSRKNYVSGEDVSYGYDELNRLVSASVAGAGGWGQTFTHDGFGNLWTQAVTKGTAPAVALSLDMATNRVNAAGWSYDANGNTTSMPVVGGGTATMGYDIENRAISWTKAGVGTEEYGYVADSKRVWKKAPDGTETVYFYGIDGKKLVTYAISTSSFALGVRSVNVYFGARLIRTNGVAVVPDRLGSVVARNNCVDCVAVTSKDYFPYGEEIGTTTAGNREKFGTYFRDQTTGLDYADQRYFTGLQGRFLSSDPYEASGGTKEPGSWGRYAYVGGDPVNFRDPSGLASEGAEERYEYCWEIGGAWVTESECAMYRMSQGKGPSTNPSTGQPAVDTQGTVISGLTYSSGGTDGWQGDAVRKTLARLSGLIDEDCEKWLFSGGPVDLLGVGKLTSFTQAAQELVASDRIGWAVVNGASGSQNNATTWSNYRDMTIIFNERGSFYQGNASRSHGADYDANISALKPGSEAMRAFIMLHEFAHYLVTPGFAKDGGNQSLVNSNNDQVWKNCSKTISRFSNK